MTCRDFIEFLASYLDRELPAEEASRFDGHLAACPSCVNYLKTYGDTIRLARSSLSDPEGPVPAEAPEDLVRAILASRTKGA